MMKATSSQPRSALEEMQRTQRRVNRLVARMNRLAERQRNGENVTADGNAILQQVAQGYRDLQAAQEAAWVDARRGSQD